MFWKRKPRPSACTSRWWAIDPTKRCMRPADGHTSHVWYDPGTGRGDDKHFSWKDEA